MPDFDWDKAVKRLKELGLTDEQFEKVCEIIGDCHGE